MDTTASSTLNAEVPPEDGAIATALADLDQKLGAWTRAVAEVQTALGEAANQSADAPVEVEASTPSPVEVREPAVPPAAEAASSETPVVAALNAFETETAFHDEEATAKAAESARTVADERLLASLDPKKAKALRIRRRLSNNSKSVRELLAEEG